MLIKIITVGKHKVDLADVWIKTLLKQLSVSVKIEVLCVKNNKQLIQLIQRQRQTVTLDSHGKTYSSQEFSDFLLSSLEKGGAQVSFVIGDSQGLPQEIKTTCPLLSLSKMTLTHHMTRLFLLEQIYRCFEIQKGSAYHK